MIAEARDLGAGLLTRLHQRVGLRNLDFLAVDIEFEQIGHGPLLRRDDCALHHGARQSVLVDAVFDFVPEVTDQTS
ncbi:MAG: hypothetical protein R3C08_02945 [Hyphomonas sp.]